MAQVGDKLGRYELMEQLGKGAAGTVFRARDSLLGIDVCVKILHSGLATQPGIIERFKRELLLARRIAHPGICKIFDIQEASGVHFLTMEYVKGETLSTILNRDGQMEAKDAVRVMRKVSEALGAAHKAGVVHRDIKPGNIIIGESERVTIVDFGVATAEDLDRLTRAGVVLGSRSYMAPETWQGAPATAAGDVWALGVILYGCVTGRLPYKGEGVVGVFDAIKNTKPMPPSALNSDVTPELEEVIFKAMCVDIEGRFPDAGAVENALATLELGFDDDGAATVVRAPSFPKAKAAEPPATKELPAPPSSAAPATSVVEKKVPAAKLPEPPRPSERLHRPAAQGLPKPPTSQPEVPPKAEPRAEPLPHKSTEEISLIGDEMSLYAPADGGEPGMLSSEQQEPTRVVGPFPLTPRNEEISAENVAEAFDAAFGLPSVASQSAIDAPPHTNPTEGPDLNDPATVVATVPPEFGATHTGGPPADDADMQGVGVMLGQQIRDEGEAKPRGPGALGLGGGPSFAPSSSGDGWQVPGTSGDDVLDFSALTNVQDSPVSPNADEGAMTGQALAAPDDVDRTTVGAALDGLSQTPSEDSFFGGAPVDATRIEARPLGPDASDELPDDVNPYAPDEDLVSLRTGPDKRLLAAAAGVVLAVVVGAVFALGGGEDSDAAAVATAGAGTGEVTAPAGDDWVFPEEGKAAGDEGAPPPADEAAGDEAAGDEDAPAAADEAGGDEAAGDEVAAATDEPAAADEAAAPEEEAVAAEEVALAADDDGDDAVEPTADDEGDRAALAAAAEEDEPAVRQAKPRRQRPSGQAAAKAKYSRKRAALSSALARKGVIAGDVPRVDAKRRAMNQAAKRRDYGRAADAADDALSELSRVQVDAAFVGRKLARFNQGYDKTRDEALRGKLKGVLKEVGADYSKGRYDDANKKLNRAFSLMRR